MRTVLLTYCLLISKLLMAQSSYEQLEMISIHQLEKEDTLRFDLSGIVEVDNRYFVISDKVWNRYIYEISLDQNKFNLVQSYFFNAKFRLDLEAIDYCDGYFYLANEKNGGIYRLNKSDLFDGKGKLELIDIPFEDKQLKQTEWGNAGWEGLAINCENQILYLVKERQPRFILPYDNKSNQLLPEFDIPNTESNDFSDAKFENGFLYLLERNGNYISKIDPASGEVIDKKYYGHICSHPEGKLFEPEKYGMAEALLLKENEIWIGLDNNGIQTSTHATNTYQIKGNNPVIIKFKRPKGF
ncbi:SdiA-regulated domain-containing protein [Reichenbachiella ulvae]|uniref:SdiA-regulated domain-containing protein n=1 Tax=Reichenbachiella ulvae TaxID=2980104 RepID=A0ABT3CVD0_9BACT|nr:esterase-like activity of phytase family protein [Reichenbachiella ulvae]MCV9387529.1 SdiA-regulated domain-containing protein [Reichenbachiella ulvae]